MKVVKSYFPRRERSSWMGFRKARIKGKKRTLMTKTKFTAGSLTLSLLLATGAFAGNINKGTLQFDETVTVAGKQLPAGKYRVEWAGDGPTVELSISDGRETVAKVPAQIVPVKKAEPTSGYSTSADPSGNKTLTGIFFSGRKYDLAIGEVAAATATPSAASN
jgi:hypothetical protein